MSLKEMLEHCIQSWRAEVAAIPAQASRSTESKFQEYVGGRAGKPAMR